MESGGGMRERARKVVRGTCGKCELQGDKPNAVFSVTPGTQSSSSSSGDGRQKETSQGTGANKRQAALSALKAGWV